MAILSVIVRNDRPIREEHHPYTWLLYKDTDIIEVRVTHDSDNRPVVLGKGAA
jgi:hypothetical protein